MNSVTVKKPVTQQRSQTVNTTRRQAGHTPNFGWQGRQNCPQNSIGTRFSATSTSQPAPTTATAPTCPAPQAPSAQVSATAGTSPGGCASSCSPELISCLGNAVNLLQGLVTQFCGGGQQGQFQCPPPQQPFCPPSYGGGGPVLLPDGNCNTSGGGSNACDILGTVFSGLSAFGGLFGGLFGGGGCSGGGGGSSCSSSGGGCGSGGYGALDDGSY